MNALAHAIWLLIFALALLGIGTVFVLYPLLLEILCIFKRTNSGEKTREDNNLPSISIIIVARNAENLITSKLRNDCNLDYPPELLDIVVFSDGSEDDMEEVIRDFSDPRVKLLSSPSHRGKAHGINEAIKECTGDLVVFSDVDALLEKDALRQMVPYYDDPEIGGVCGQRVVEKSGKTTTTGRAQMLYIGVDSTIKKMESAIGSVTSNDGKLYSIRRELFLPLEGGAVDDLNNCLNIIARGKRFVYTPLAQAVVPVPSKNARQEIMRRRRIVCRSMKAIFSHSELFNPLKHGGYGLRLLTNKVLRRLLPVNLLALFVATIVLAFTYPVFQLFAVLQGLGYLLAGAYPLLPHRMQARGVVSALSETAYYFCLGNLGTLLGIFDYLRGREYVTWEPIRRKGANR